MRAEFEEKTYEQHLTAELANGRQFFPPGQVLENMLGFDVALRTGDRHFWRHFRHMYPFWREMMFLAPPGVLPDTRWWRELERELDFFPKFKFNCFLQVKRADRMVRSDAAEYACWNAPYFRYEIRANQQTALEMLTHKTTGKAIVAYACPAFYELAELWAAISERQLVEQSNFCEASKLKGHGRYTYIEAGNVGIGHSEPTPIESAPFEQTLERLFSQESNKNNVAFLAETGEMIHDIAEHIGPLSKTYNAIVSKLLPDVESKLAKSLVRIYAFEFVSRSRLLVGYED